MPVDDVRVKVVKVTARYEQQEEELSLDDVFFGTIKCTNLF